MKVRSAMVAVPALAAALVPAGEANAGSSRGAQLAAACAACHRLDGEDTRPIVGLDRERLIGVMKAFRTEGVSNHIMHAVSLTLTDDELAVLADDLAGRGKGQP